MILIEPLASPSAITGIALGDGTLRLGEGKTKTRGEGILTETHSQTDVDGIREQVEKKL